MTFIVSFRKSSQKSENDEEKDCKLKVKKSTSASTSTSSASPTTSSSSPTSSNSSPIDEASSSPVKIEKDELTECWNKLENGEGMNNLLKSGVVKNKNMIRFECQTISLSSEDV